MAAVSAQLERPIFVSTVQFDRQIAAGTLSVVDIAPIAAQLGVQGIEYRDVHWKDKATELPVVKRQLLKYKLRAAYTSTLSLYESDADRQKQLFLDLEDARDLGAILLRVTLGVPPAENANRGVQYAARKAVERAAALRVALSIENAAQPPGHSMTELNAALATFSCRWVGTNIDFANYVATGQDPLAAIRLLSRWINYVHAKDAVRTPDGWSTTVLGHGGLPLKEIIAAVDATGRSMPFCLEVPGGDDPEGAIRESVDVLRGL